MTEAPTSAVYLLKRAELAVRGCAGIAFSEVALTPSQYYILFLVKCGEATSSAELARAMGVLPQSMTELIAPLEKRGAIVRRPDSTNNRILRIELTNAGQRLFERGTELAIRFERELLEGLNREDLDHLCRGLSTLIAKAERHSYHPKLRRLHKGADKPKVARAACKKSPRQRTGRRP
jgi:DNA-binding MarR family transcriptional regulator